jgi:hypothetical protein
MLVKHRVSFDRAARAGAQGIVWRMTLLLPGERTDRHPRLRLLAVSAGARYVFYRTNPALRGTNSDNSGMQMISMRPLNSAIT